MSIPTVGACLIPLLRVLAQSPEGLPSGAAQERAAEVLALSREDRAVELPSGGSAFRNRVAWAQVRLKKAGLTDNPAKGVWRITRKGQALLEAGEEATDARVRRALSTRAS